MRIQLRRHLASDDMYRMQTGGLFRLLCRLKYLRLLFLFSLVLFIIFITSQLKDVAESDSFTVYHGKDLIFFQDPGDKYWKSYRKAYSNKTLSNTESYQNISLKRKRFGVESNKLMSISGTETLQDKTHCHSWCKRKTNTSGIYFISAVLLVRIYSTDLAKLSTRELMQWLYYLRYAGFEHVYIYDAYVLKNESQKDALDFFIKQGFVTYVDWSHKAYPYTVSGTQESAYQDCLDKRGNQSIWQSSFDIDEYPFCPQDTKPNFIQRFIANYSTERPETSQITMQNFLFLGKPLNDDGHPLLIDRLKRRTHGPSNALVKPIYKTSHVMKTGVHHHELLKGKSEDADQRLIRLNHYWGARLQNWGEDTPEILAKTKSDNTVEEIVHNLLQCDSVCLPDTSLIYKFRWS